MRSTVLPFQSQRTSKVTSVTPAGVITPEPRTHPYSGETSRPQELPSASPPFALKAGVSSLSFTGQFGAFVLTVTRGSSSGTCTNGMNLTSSNGGTGSIPVTVTP